MCRFIELLNDIAYFLNADLRSIEYWYAGQMETDCCVNRGLTVDRFLRSNIKRTQTWLTEEKEFFMEWCCKLSNFFKDCLAAGFNFCLSRPKYTIDIELWDIVVEKGAASKVYLSIPIMEKRL